MIWIEFIFCAALTIWAGSKLAKYGDIIAEKKGLGKAWFGAILIAGVTSLPELASGISAVAWLNAPNLAAGTLLGSCLFNLALIAIMDLAYQPSRVLAKAHEVHILSGGLGILMLGLVVMAVLVGASLNISGILGLNVLSLVLVAIYLLGGVMISNLEKERMDQVLTKEARVGHYEKISSRRAYLVFLLSTISIVGLGIWLSNIGVRLSDTTGLSRSFIGNLFIAFSTSLPEVTSSISAIRLGAIDLAIGNVLGSNLFNIALFFIYDLVDVGSRFWYSLDESNGFAAVITMMMTGVVIISLMHRSTRRSRIRISWDGLALLFMYAVAIATLYWLV